MPVVRMQLMTAFRSKTTGEEESNNLSEGRLNVLSGTRVRFRSAHSLPFWYPPCSLGELGAYIGTSRATFARAILNLGELLRDKPNFCIGEVTLTLTLEGFDSPLVPRLPVPKAALFAGDKSEPTNDVVSATRKASALLTRSPDVADPVYAAHLFTAARLRFLRSPHSLWLEHHLLQVPLAQEAWPNIPPYLAQLGKDFVSKFISTNANSTSVAACQKVLHLNMRGMDSQTEFPAEQYTYSQTTLYDSRGADVSDAGVLAVADRHWDAQLLAGAPSPAGFK
jgi:hypothetical protein